MRLDEELSLTLFEEIFVVGTSHVRPTLLIIDGVMGRTSLTVS